MFNKKRGKKEWAELAKEDISREEVAQEIKSAGLDYLASPVYNLVLSGEKNTIPEGVDITYDFNENRWGAHVPGTRISEYFDYLDDALKWVRVPENIIDPEPEDPGRRRFMAGLATSGAAVAAGSLFERPSEAGLEKKQVPVAVKEAEPQESFEKRTLDLIVRFRKFDEDIERQYGGFFERTIADQDAVRKRFLEEMGEDYVAIMREAGDNAPKEVYQSLGSVLYKVDAYGLYLADMERSGKHADLLKDSREKMHHRYYSSRASDYLPTGDIITLSEIDPRVWQAADEGNFAYKKEVQKTMVEFPGWAAHGASEHFKRVLDNPEVRELLQSSNCTLAESYSLIKSLIKNNSRGLSKGTPRESMQFLLEQRERFLKLELIGPEVEELLVFVANEDGFSTAKIEAFAKEEVPNSQIEVKPIVGEVFEKDNGDMRRGARAIFGSSIEEDEKEVLPIGFGADAGLSSLLDRKTEKDLVENISKTRGKTTLWFDTHGSRGSLLIDRYVDLKDKTIASNSMNVSSFAKGLVKRIVDTDDPKTLENITIMVGACHSYDFTLNLGSAIAQEYRKVCGNPEQLALPHIVTASNEGSLSYKGGLQDVFALYGEALKKEGKLTGEYLMRRLQADKYRIADIGFFMSQSGGGKMVEIGQIDIEEQSESMGA